MKYKLLGHTGLRVSEICLGTMTFGEEWGYGAGKDESRRIFDTFLDAGGNFIDTANRYTEGTSEQYLGEFIQTDRHRIVLATKYTLFDRKGDPNFSGNHRKNLMRSVEASLRRLNTDFIDVLYVHAWDFLTPVEEVLRGFDDLVHSGKVLYAGISDTPAWVVAQANAVADTRGWTRFNALQLEYSLLQRTVESELLPMAKATDMAVTAWAPLAGGALTGKYLGDAAVGRVSPQSARRNERSAVIAREVVAVAAELGCTPAQVAIRWTMQRGQPIIPIVGARTAEQFNDSLGAIAIELTAEQMERLDAASAVEHGFPNSFFRQDAVQSVIYGGTAGDVINHRF